jgi:arylsulfatase A-like enzyme/thioredoxin-like negative regulator of GroEL
MLVLLLTIALSLPAAGPDDDVSARPSVLLVTLDTTRADHLGCYGAEFAATPNLDALAGRGVRFDEALSPTPLTLPSHASLLTGMVPRKHGVRDNAMYRLGEEPEVLAAVLGRRGYDTAAFVSSVVLDRIGGLDRGFDLYDDSVRIGERQAFAYREKAAAQTNDAVLGHLDKLKEPFFLWVHYFDPHLPYVPPEPFRSRFEDRPYDGEIAFMDAEIGSLLEEVGKQTSSLMVVVAGDHGESLGEHGEDAHGIFVYQATQRVPLIFAGPGLPKGKVVKERVGLTDVAPTVLDMLGLPPLSDADGRSLLPLLRGAEWSSGVYELETLFPYHAYGWAPLRGLVRGEYKFIEAPDDELYRLSSDPDEKKDLSESKSGLASAMAARLGALTEGDIARPFVEDPELAEQRRKLEALGYLSRGASPDAGDPIDPKDGIPWLADLEAGREAYQTGEPAKGIEPLQKLLSRNPRNVPALLALANCYIRSGSPKDAEKAARQALDIQPNDDLAHFNLANALSASELAGQARRHYERALELNPRFADAYLNYAALLERTGKDREALALLERARANGVQDPDLENGIAMHELKRGNPKAAEQALIRSLVLRPRDSATLEALSRLRETLRNSR